MGKSIRGGAVLVVVLAFLPSFVMGAGGTAQPTRPELRNEPAKTPEDQAIDHYNAGLRLRDKAWKLESKAAAASSDKKRAKYEKKTHKLYGRAIEEFEAATEKNPEFHEAFSDLGYALRKTGDYGAALNAYNRALDLAPAYTEAIEYRAEAYLGLDRLDEAKSAYIQLFSADRPRADQLLVAMSEWVAERQTDPGGVAPDVVSRFADWVAEREDIARQTPSVSQLQNRKW